MASTETITNNGNHKSLFWTVTEQLAIYQNLISKVNSAMISNIFRVAEFANGRP